MVSRPRSVALAAVLAAVTGACATSPITPPARHARDARTGQTAAVATSAAPDAELATEVFSAARMAAAAALKRRDYREAERLLAAEIERTGVSDPLLGDLAQVRATAVLAAKAPGSAAFDLAITALDRAIARQPKSARLFALRGAVAAKEGRYANARGDFERALALSPGDTAVRLDAADLSAMLRDFNAADREYRAAIAARPGDFDAWLQRAIVLRARIDEGGPEGWAERYRAARDALTSAMAVDPTRIETRYHFAVLLLDHGVQGTGAGIEPPLLLARELLRRFLEEANGKPALAAEYRRAKALLSMIDDATHCNFLQTEADRKAAEAQARQREAELEAEEAAPAEVE